jgi:hypothetical protein
MSSAQNVNNNRKDAAPLTHFSFERQDKGIVHSFTLAVTRTIEPKKDKRGNELPNRYKVTLSFKITSKDHQVREAISALLGKVDDSLRRETRVTRSRIDTVDQWIIVDYDVSDLEPINPTLLREKLDSRISNMLLVIKRYLDTGIVPYRDRKKGKRVETIPTEY